MKKLLLLLAFLAWPHLAWCQVTADQVLPGYLSTSSAVCPGTNNPCFVPAVDPCAFAAKTSVVINATTAATTALVSLSSGKSVYVCGFSLSIAPSATSADTAAFEYGTGASCSSPTTLTGTFGNGDLTTATGLLQVSYGAGGVTVFSAPASNAICLVTTGTTVNVQGVLTYIQQ